MRVTDLIPWRSGQSDRSVAAAGRNPVAALQTDVNRAFNDFWRLVATSFERPSIALSTATDVLRVDVAESDQEVTVTAELPGLSEDDVEVQVSDGWLTIRGTRSAEREKAGETYIVRERQFGLIERTIPLPEGVDPEKAKASVKSGLLTVTIPKKVDGQSSQKRIPVEAI